MGNYIESALMLQYECTKVQNPRRTRVRESLKAHALDLLPANHSTISCRIALRWPSVAARILIRKLCYVLRLRLLDNIASVLFQTSNPLHLSIIRECHFLEDHLSLHGYTDKVLNGEYDGSKKYLRDSILNDE